MITEGKLYKCDLCDKEHFNPKPNHRWVIFRPSVTSQVKITEVVAKAICERCMIQLFNVAKEAYKVDSPRGYPAPPFPIEEGPIPAKGATMARVECDEEGSLGSCTMCNGEACATHSGSPCDCDTADRHVSNNEIRRTRVCDCDTVVCLECGAYQTTKPKRTKQG